METQGYILSLHPNLTEPYTFPLYFSKGPCSFQMEEIFLKSHFTKDTTKVQVIKVAKQHLHSTHYVPDTALSAT